MVRNGTSLGSAFIFEHGFLAGRKVLCGIGGVREPCTAVQMVGGRELEKYIDRWLAYFRISQSY
jgi:hypothetical protein